MLQYTVEFISLSFSFDYIIPFEQELIHTVFLLIKRCCVLLPDLARHLVRIAFFLNWQLFRFYQIARCFLIVLLCLLCFLRGNLRVPFHLEDLFLCRAFFQIELNGSEHLRKLGDIFSSMSAFERLPFSALQT